MSVHVCLEGGEEVGGVSYMVSYMLALLLVVVVEEAEIACMRDLSLTFA